MPLKREAAKVLAHGDSHDVHDGRESESESGSSSPAAVGAAPAAQSHFKRSFQGSPMRHSVAADNSIVVTTPHVPPISQPPAAVTKGALHPVSPALRPETPVPTLASNINDDF